MVAIEFKNELKEYLNTCKNRLANAQFNDERTFYSKAILLTTKQLELAERGWDQIDIAKVSYIMSKNAVNISVFSLFRCKISQFMSKFRH